MYSFGTYHEYDHNGNETYNRHFRHDTTSSEEKSFYDAQHRLIKIEQFDYDNNYTTLTTYEYDGTNVYPAKCVIIKGDEVGEKYYYYKNDLMIKTIRGSFEQLFEYDNMERLISYTYPGNIMSFHYENNKVTTENSAPQAKYRTREKIYNEEGLLIESIGYDNNKQINSYHFYTYDTNGNIIFVDYRYDKNETLRDEYFYDYYEVQDLSIDGQPIYNNALRAYNEADYTLVIDLLKSFPETSSLYDDAIALMLKALEKLKTTNNMNFVSVYGQINNPRNINISGYIIFEDLISGSEVGKCRIGKNGYYYIILPSGKRYSYYIDAAGFYPLSRIADFTSPAQGLILNDNITLVSLDEMSEQQVSIRINNIFFDFNESILKPESFLELDRLYNVLNSNPDIKVEISGHTDNVGSDEYNNKLSQSRSEAVKDYLVKKGINTGRIISKGYGKSNPVTTNDTEESRQLNRRVEFKILKK